MHRLPTRSVLFAMLLSAIMPTVAHPDNPVPRLQSRDGHFVDTAGNRVRFWGVNLISTFPSPEDADDLADALASLQVNLVRPHHLMRPSGDWVWHSDSKALALYESDSRTPNVEAWERFDALNAALRRRGIYLAFSLHWSRTFRPADVAILDVSPDDNQAWADAIDEMLTWPWQKSIDPIKMLPAIDPRARKIQEEFALRLLHHRNPHTGLTYAEDPQVVTFEIVNESSVEYAMICENVLPEYFEARLQQAWEEFARGAGRPEPGNHRTVRDPEVLRLRSAFYRSLDEQYFRSMLALIREAGSEAVVTYSNLWRGQDALAMHASIGGVIEDHAYVDPLIVRSEANWVDTLTRTAVEGRPLILGEFNQAEGERNIREQAFARTMLMPTAAAYGGLQDWDGIVWFAYNHGDRHLGSDGWARQEGREASLGDMVRDGMMLDHMATCGLLFRQGLARAAVETVSREIRVPAAATNYHQLMEESSPLHPGEATVRAFRKRFVPETHPVGTPSRPLPSSPFISDTGEIVRDLERRQFTLSAPGAEAFSGFLDGQAIDPLRHLRIEPANGFASVVLVAADGRPLAESTHLLLSRTWLDRDGPERDGLSLRLENLAPPPAGQLWRMRPTRPRSTPTVLRELAGIEEVPIPLDSESGLVLPARGWHACELLLDR